MSEFSFDPELSPQQNIERFLKHLEIKDHEMAALLRANLGKLSPLPTEPQERTAARKAFNQAVADSLDKLDKDT